MSCNQVRESYSSSLLALLASHCVFVLQSKDMLSLFPLVCLIIFLTSPYERVRESSRSLCDAIRLYRQESVSFCSVVRLIYILNFVLKAKVKLAWQIVDFSLHSYVTFFFVSESSILDTEHYKQTVQIRYKLQKTL